MPEVNNKVKKPPILVSELNKDPGTEPKKGGLTYVDQGKNNSGGGGTPGKPKMNLTQLILAVGLSILIFVLISNFWLTPKKDATILLENQKLLETNQAALTTTVASFDSKLNTDSGRIENLISSQANYATRAEVTGFAKTTDLAGYATASSLQGLSSSITELLGRLTGYDTRITSLENKVNNLTGGNSTIVGGSSYCYLIESTNGYKLVAKSNLSGYFIARVTLVLDTPEVLLYEIGPDRSFIENSAYVDSEWRTVSITFYTGEFKLTVGIEKGTLEIPLELSSEVESIGYVAYVEILPSAVTASPPSGDII